MGKQLMNLILKIWEMMILTYKLHRMKDTMEDCQNNAVLFFAVWDTDTAVTGFVYRKNHKGRVKNVRKKG